jgi:hypothetical protein
MRAGTAVEWQKQTSREQSILSALDSTARERTKKEPADAVAAGYFLTLSHSEVIATMVGLHPRNLALSHIDLIGSTFPKIAAM